MTRIAIGLRAHSGWAAMVALREPVAAPLVVLRRRLEFVDRGVEGAAQPYHAAQGMKLSEAEAFLAERASVTQALAIQALRRAIGDHAISRACILLGSGRVGRDLASTLASHPMIHTAEGEFFREALRTACESCGVPVLGIREKEIWDRAVRELRVERGELEGRVAELGKLVGPPWRQDEKLSALAAWVGMTVSV